MGEHQGGGRGCLAVVGAWSSSMGGVGGHVCVEHCVIGGVLMLITGGCLGALLDKSIAILMNMLLTIYF